MADDEIIGVQDLPAEISYNGIPDQTSISEQHEGKKYNNLIA